jgi:hypothetical protein
MLTTGSGSTVTAAVVAEQPVVASVKVNVAFPSLRPVTRPPDVTEATDGELLTHVPPIVGDRVVVSPIHIVLSPVMLTTGSGFTVKV